VKRALPVVLVAAAVVGAAAVAGGIKYNAVRADLSAQRDAIRAQWAQVDLAIEHRANQAPQWLRLTLAGTPEAAVLEKELTAGRADLAAAASPEEKVRANQRIAVALAQFQTLAVEHPRLQSHDVLARLSDAENRIAVERRRYNDMLEHYNAQIQRFPDNIVASLAGFSRDNAYFPTEPRP
jgi:LemA protein